MQANGSLSTVVFFSVLASFVIPVMFLIYFSLQECWRGILDETLYFMGFPLLLPTTETLSALYEKHRTSADGGYNISGHIVYLLITILMRN